MLCHDAYQLFKTGLPRIPSQQCFCFGGVAQQLFHFGRPEIFGVDFHEDFSGLCVDTLLIHSLAFPAQSDAYLSECQCRKFAYGMHFSGGNDEVFGGVVREIMPVQADVKGRTLIMIEDIIDTGFTMQYVMDKLRKDGAADVKLATMLFKPDSLRCNLRPDYIGIRIPSDFIVGYGLDYDEMGRAYRNIYKIIDN